MRTRPLFLLLLAGVTPARMRAQDRDLLPMTYVRVDDEVAGRLASDWKQLRRHGAEWVYCVTRWTAARSQDGDTVLVITEIRPAASRASLHQVTEFSCTGPDGGPLPLVHAHPSGDCSVSRDDAKNAIAYRIPFGLIVCGERSTAGYTRSQYVLMMRGVAFARTASSP